MTGELGSLQLYYTEHQPNLSIVENSKGKGTDQSNFMDNHLAKYIICGAGAVMIYTSIPLCRGCEYKHSSHLPEHHSTQTWDNGRNVYVSGISDSTTTITTQQFYIG